MMQLSHPATRRFAQAAAALFAAACLMMALSLGGLSMGGLSPETSAPGQESRRADSPPAASRRPAPADRAADPAPARRQETARQAASESRREPAGDSPADAHTAPLDYWSMLFVFALSTLIGLGVIGRVSRLLHTPLMSLTNAISAIAVVGAIIVAGSDYPPVIRALGAIALFASMTNIVSGFLITDRMLKMFKSPTRKAQP